MVDASTRWDDPAWREKGDSPLARRLRRHQGWWREVVAQQPPGPAVGGDRLVVSMLPETVATEVNLMWPEAVTAYETARRRLKETKAPGLIQPDRMRRNLLSSQPLCFNLFGYLAAHPDSLLPWVRQWSPDATKVSDVSLEHAPAEGTFARSAFDAYVEYELGDGHRGFLGIECKYAEDLVASQREPAAPKFAERTTSEHWLDGAALALDQNGLRQLWYNTLLGQHVLRTADVSEGHVVVLALGVDQKAAAATAAVRDQLLDPAFLSFAPIEGLVDAVEGHEAWRDQFRTRYLDLDRSAERA